GLKQAVNGIRALTPTSEIQTKLPMSTANGSRPGSYADALQRILAGSPGRRSWPLVDLLAEMKRRQWMEETNKHPLETLRVAANTLVGRGALRKAGPGIYGPVRQAVSEATADGSGRDG